MQISYTTDLSGVSNEMLKGFFVGWSRKPTPEQLFQLLTTSQYRVVAIDNEQVVGFITAISDKTLAAYIPFLEVLPKYQEQGIGSELMSRMLGLLKEFYMIDLLCDVSLQSFYERFGMQKATGMMLRNFDKIQS